MKLEIPPRFNPTRDSFDTSPKQVRAWVDALPLANSGEVARILFSTLRETNRTNIEPTERFKLLETFRPPVRHIAKALEAHYIGKAFPLTAGNRKVAKLACEFQGEMALGYKIVVHDLRMVTGLPAILHKPLLVTSVQRALHHLSQILVRSYQIYAPYPPNVWREIHSLYQLATEDKIERKPINDPENRLVKELTIADTYKQVLLLALSNPYRLRQGGVLKVYTALEKWARYCNLTPIKDPQHKPRGLFGVQPDSDDQPSYLALGDGHERTSAVGWVLDTTPLAQLLRDQLAYLAADPDAKDKRNAIAKSLPPGISSNCLRRVMESWGMMARRTFSRVDKTESDTIDVTVGISGIYHFVSGREALQIEDSEEEEAEVEEEVSLEALSGWAMDSKPQTVQHHAHSCQVMDESTGGYRLRWPTDGNIKARVGDLLGICCDDAHNNVSRGQWRIGVVRWMRAADKENMEVGIQMLAPGARGAAVRLCNAENRCGDYLRCLLLPALKPIGQPETLITPGFLLKYATRIQVLVDDVERTAKLTKTLESTGSFAQFEFEYIEPEKPPVQVPVSERRKPAEDFDSVWSKI